MFNACSLPSFQQVSGIGRIFFPYLAREEVSSCRLRRARSSLVSREVGGACLFFEMDFFFTYMGGSSLHVEDGIETYTLLLKTGGVLSMFTRSELSSASS